MSFEIPIERGKIREFARAAQSDNPAYTGPQPVSPPTFLTIARLSWQPEGASILDEIGFDIRRVLHAEEEFVFSGPPPKAGTVLDVSSRAGETYEKQGRRGGTLRFGTVVTEFRDAAGELVAEQRTLFVETGRAPGADG